MQTIVVTGASRGIGRELARRYAGDGWRVIAAVRDPASLADADFECDVHPLDLEDGASIAALGEALRDESIDILWNNAGVYLDKGVSLANLDDADWLRTFHINTVAPVRLAHVLVEPVARSKGRTFAFTTSKMGSIAGNAGGAYAYRSSKAALNMAVGCLSRDLAERDVKTVLLHPGWVRTDMGGEGADISVAESAEGMKEVVDGLVRGDSHAKSGGFYNYDGAELPW